MIVINKINYVHEDMAIEIYMNGGFVIRLWADKGCEDSFKALNEFSKDLSSAIEIQQISIKIPDEVYTKTWGI